jgi:hypothetical protein
MVQNPQVASHTMLADMVSDAYYPAALVAKGQQILLRLAERIEDHSPRDLEALYRLTHAATEEFNRLAEEFEHADSEIETVARDAISEDFGFLADVYGYSEADLEELVAPRDW